MFDCYYSSDLKQMHEMSDVHAGFTESYFPLRQAQQTNAPKKVILFGSFCSFFLCSIHDQAVSYLNLIFVI